MADLEAGRGQGQGHNVDGKVKSFNPNVDGRPLGPDGRPLPGPAQMQQIMAQKRTSVVTFKFLDKAQTYPLY